MTKTASKSLATLALTVLLSSAAHAQPITVANSVPAPNGTVTQLGDGWTFKCPKGGTYSASVDTIDDDGEGNATLDPFFQVHDGTGLLVATQDDNVTCTFTPLCGFTCPSASGLPCGDKNPHLLRIGDNSGHTGCVGGGYELTLEVKDKNGVVLPPKKVKLGGGPNRKLPKWFDPGKGRKQGPLLDDEQIF